MADRELERAFWVAVAEVPGVGPSLFTTLFAHFGSAEAIWEASEQELAAAGVSERVVGNIVARRAVVDPLTHLKTLANFGVSILCSFENNYPLLLSKITRRPPVLFVRGALTRADDTAIAVVGTRKPTPYGREVTERLVTELVAYGFTIVSGLARGVDGIAHRTALAAGGRTVAWLGGGIDSIYPAEHKGLAEEIVKNGAILSEFTPGFRPLRGNFPARNRLISGMSLGVVVVEGLGNSGTISTAMHAFSQNRPVFAVPGPITSPLSAAPHELLTKGAKLVGGVKDILKVITNDQLTNYQINTNNQILSSKQQLVSNSLRKPAFNSEAEERLWELLANGQLEVDELVRESKLSSQVVLSALTMMELVGAVKHLGSGVWCRSG